MQVHICGFMTLTETGLLIIRLVKCTLCPFVYNYINVLSVRVFLLLLNTVPFIIFNVAFRKVQSIQTCLLSIFLLVVCPFVFIPNSKS